MAYFARELSGERLAEIRAQLDQPPPIRAVAASNYDKSPVASYLNLLRDNQMDLVNEIDRLKAELEAARSLPNRDQCMAVN
jgi:hypothetical protein